MKTLRRGPPRREAVDCCVLVSAGLQQMRHQIIMSTVNVRAVAPVDYDSLRRTSSSPL